MKQVFIGVLAIALALVGLNAQFSVKWATAAAAVPSCQFGGYDQYGSQINTGITCVTPAASGAPQSTPTGGNCIAVSTPPAAGSIAYTCDTPGPQSTPSPSATSTTTAGTPACTWSGSWPYTLNCAFPAAGGGSSYTPAPGATPAYDAAVLALSGLQDFWKMEDNPNSCVSACTPGPCPSTMADSGPANIPLTTPTPTVTVPTCGVAAPIKDGTTGVAMNNIPSTKSYFYIPSHQIGTLCNGNAGGACTNSFSISCVVSYSVYPDSDDIFFTGDPAADTAMSLGVQSGVLTMFVAGAAHTIGTANTAPIGQPLVWVFTFNAGGPTSILYLNGVPVFTGSLTPTIAANKTSFFGVDLSSNGLTGRMSKCFTTNTALSAIAILELYQTSALP